MSPTLASAINSNEGKIRANKGLSDIFLNPLTNQTYKLNETMKRLTLAKTLETISEQGPSAFYDGELSQTIVEENNFNS